jgi:hypothetical protein
LSEREILREGSIIYFALGGEREKEKHLRVGGLSVLSQGEREEEQARGGGRRHKQRGREFREFFFPVGKFFWW